MRENIFWEITKQSLFHLREISWKLYKNHKYINTVEVYMKLCTIFKILCACVYEKLISMLLMKNS